MFPAKIKTRTVLVSASAQRADNGASSRAARAERSETACHAELIKMQATVSRYFMSFKTDEFRPALEASIARRFTVLAG